MFDLQETVEITASSAGRTRPCSPGLETDGGTQGYNKSIYEGVMPELIGNEDSETAQILFYLDRFGGFVNPLQQGPLLVAEADHHRPQPLGQGEDGVGQVGAPLPVDQDVVGRSPLGSRSSASPSATIDS